MSYDTIASLQRMQQLEQAQATAEKRLILKRVNSTLDIWIFILAFLLFIPTLGFSLMLAPFIYFGKELFTKTCMVKNVATGEKFKVDKQDFKQYKKAFKTKEKQVRRISDLETNTVEIDHTDTIIHTHHEPKVESIKEVVEVINTYVEEPRTKIEEILPDQQTLKPESEPIPIPSPLPIKLETNNTLTFNIAGVTFDNDKGKDIQSLLRRIARAIAKEYDIEAYGGYTNKELLEIWGEASEFEDVEFGDYISFVKDPDNEFDKNAIKVIVNLDGKEFHIGHVPKKQNIEIGKLLDSESITSILANFVGGKTKSVDYDDEKDKDVVVITELTLGVLITLRFEAESD
ncbi:HIRAN domain-containing protein [Bacillus thuringiensis]|uniref:HIRAN domain-containing protein n=1 Tax=Bacillus thuringiensis TaxID=1428 RepID=UPI0008ABF70A|nr:HIRAN domain-containing protein [Bacillus thuringiensis]MCU4885134.1 HIRAN domain-containing protein [Bacillus cereus]SEJ43816.1 HIRAN domain-containing protein [Bacillus thuringiensis]